MSNQFRLKRPTIGVIINEFEGIYHAQLRSGIEHVAKEREVNILYISGKALKSPYSMDNPYNVIYNMIQFERFQGLILTSGSLTNFCGVEELVGMLQCYQSLPMVSISSQIQGIPSITTNNSSGIKEALRHLIDIHHAKRIGFIKGPEYNIDACERYNAYLEILHEYEIPFDPALVYAGDFCFPTGATAVRTLLDERHVTFDALVSSNDDMAHSAIVELKRRNIHIPSEIAVTGYDDIQVVQNLTPPLTTVTQPLFEQGATALRLVLDMIDQKEVPDVTELASHLVIRESCGCLPRIIERCNPSLEVLALNKSHTKESLIHDFVDSVTVANDQVPLTKAFEALIKILAEATPVEERYTQFLNGLNEALHKTINEGRSVLFWQEAIGFLRMYNSDLFMESLKIDELCYKAQVLIGGAIRRQESMRRIPIYHILWSMRNFVTQSNALLNIEDLDRTLRDNLPYFAFRTCYVALYPMRGLDEKRGPMEIQDHLQLTIAINDDSVMQSDFLERLYPTQWMLPDDCFPVNERFSWVVQSLANREEQLGIMILDLVNEEPLVYPSLREQVSCVVQGIQLFQRQSKTELRLKQTLDELESINRVLQEQSFRDELTGLYNRRGFLAIGQEHQKQAHATGSDYLLFFADMDDLKRINDEYGHSEGDFAIQATAEILKRSFTGPSDLVARYGGDEFVSLAVGCSEKDIPSMTQRIMMQIEKFNNKQKKPYPIKMSIGTAVWHAESNIEFNELLLEADRRLYIEKSRKKARLLEASAEEDKKRVKVKKEHCDQGLAL